MVEHLHTSFVLYILDSLFGGFLRPSVSDAVVPVRPELRLHSLTVITQIGKFYKRTKKSYTVSLSQHAEFELGPVLKGGYHNAQIFLSKYFISKSVIKF